MARYIGPSCRQCRAENTKLFLKGSRCMSPKCPVTRKKNAPGKAPRARAKKLSDYGQQLREKQKVKRIYGMLESQFRIYFAKADRKQGKTGENLISLLEQRLDNIVYRLRFATSRKQARQMVLHGHVYVNGRRVNIPSYQLRVDDVIEIKELSQKMTVIKDSLKEYTKSGIVPWLELDPDAMKGTIKGIPSRTDITELAHVKEQLIVELYSK